MGSTRSRRYAYICVFGVLLIESPLVKPCRRFSEPFTGPLHEEHEVRMVLAPPHKAFPRYKMMMKSFLLLGCVAPFLASAASTARVNLEHESSPKYVPTLQELTCLFLIHRPFG